MGELSTADYAAVLAGRRALVAAIEKRVPPRHAQHLAAVAVTGQFVDLVVQSPGRDDLVAVINASLAEAGLMLVESRRQ
jgi:hypothetical protein